MTDHDADNIGWAARWVGAPCIDNPQLWDGETRDDAKEAARQCVGTERKRYTVRGAATANRRRHVHEAKREARDV